MVLHLRSPFLAPFFFFVEEMVAYLFSVDLLEGLFHCFYDTPDLVCDSFSFFGSCKHCLKKFLVIFILFSFGYDS